MPCEWFTLDPNCDIPNWLTMTIELSIGGGIASLFFFRQWIQGKKIQNVIDEQDKHQKRRYYFSLGYIHSHLINVRNSFKTRDELEKEYASNPNANQKELEPEIIGNILLAKEAFEDIKTMVGLSNDVLDPADATNILNFCQKWIEEFTKAESRNWTLTSKFQMIIDIQELFKKLPNPPI